MFSIFDFYSTLPSFSNHPLLITLQGILLSFPLKEAHQSPLERETIQLVYPTPPFSERSRDLRVIEWYSNVDTFFIESLVSYKEALDVLAFHTIEDRISSRGSIKVGRRLRSTV